MAILPIDDAGSAPPLHHQMTDLGTCNDFQILALACRFQKGSRAAAPPAPPHRHLKLTDTFLIGAIIIIRSWITQPGRGIDPGIHHITAQPACRYIQGPALAAHL